MIRLSPQASLLSVPAKLHRADGYSLAFLTLLVNLGFAAILGFMASFAKEASLLASSKYFFLVYALFTVCSLPFTGRWFDSRGANSSCTRPLYSLP